MTKRKKHTAPKRASKAIARRPAPRAVTRPMMPARRSSPTPAPLTNVSTLDDAIALGDFGLVELKFTKEEELVLSEPAPFDELRVKPTGQVYLPHTGYTRWLNRAFGRTGWALKPASKPLLNQNTVVVPYLLMVHGKPIAFALGEQEYFANNKDQSYGDALESTVASGLRRCCKHLGIGLELWDRALNDEFLDRFCVRVPCNVKGKGDAKDSTKRLWRRKVDPPFWNEVRGRQTAAREAVDEDLPRGWEPADPTPKDVTPASHHRDLDQPITSDQVVRLWTIARRRGRTDEEIKRYLAGRGINSSKAIARRDYETICQAIEAPGALAYPREPGEEG